ncbi:MAG TPA: septum formation initiator family protein [Candidatus Saccharimonadales bacterium]|nr:septum formation initiator family protein [Candidatus Saccharimonadales bacterium]
MKDYLDIIKAYVAQLQDLRVIGQLLFLAVAMLVTWSGIKTIETNYGLQKQIAALEQQNEVKKLATENQKLQNDYYKTPQYLELAARQEFGLAAPGETVLIVPREVALAHTVELPKPQEPAKAEGKNAELPAYQRNFEAWMDFFLHRKPS